MFNHYLQITKKFVNDFIHNLTLQLCIIPRTTETRESLFSELIMPAVNKLTVTNLIMFSNNKLNL